MHIDGACHCRAVSSTAEVIIQLGCVNQRAQLQPAVQIWQHSLLPAAAPPAADVRSHER